MRSSRNFAHIPLAENLWLWQHIGSLFLGRIRI